MLSEGERQILDNLVKAGGYLPDRPTLARPESTGLMQKGLIEAVDPPQEPGRCKYLPYVMITPAGKAALEASDDT